MQPILSAIHSNFGRVHAVCLIFIELNEQQQRPPTVHWRTHSSDRVTSLVQPFIRCATPLPIVLAILHDNRRTRFADCIASRPFRVANLSPITGIGGQPLTRM